MSTGQDAKLPIISCQLESDSYSPPSAVTAPFDGVISITPYFFKQHSSFMHPHTAFMPYNCVQLSSAGK